MMLKNSKQSNTKQKKKKKQKKNKNVDSFIKRILLDHIQISISRTVAVLLTTENRH